MNLITYLERHLLTTDRLLRAAGISVDHLRALQLRRLVPQPSYRLALDIACTSFFGPHTEKAAVDYYGSGYPAWIADVALLENEADGFALFSRRYRNRMPEASAEHLAAEWEHFLAGTYGLCTTTGLPEQIAAKESAVITIKSMCERVLTDAEREILRIAVNQLDAASAPFAPHEVARSSRRRLVDEVRERYQLSRT
jgi:hypothetical protein